jgi:hypothetical protein
MSYPYARTFDEAYLYMELRPCVCGATDFDQTTTTSIVDGARVVRYSGRCPNCGRERRFTFSMSGEPQQLSFETKYGWGDEPSRLLDPGEWLGMSDMFEANARAELGDGDEVTDDDVLTAAFYLLSSAVAATEEVLKFLPPGSDDIPEEAFRSQPGRLLFELVPQRFGRARLTEELASRQRAMAEFERRYGDDARVT